MVHIKKRAARTYCGRFLFFHSGRRIYMHTRVYCCTDTGLYLYIFIIVFRGKTDEKRARNGFMETLIRQNAVCSSWPGTTCPLSRHAHVRVSIVLYRSRVHATEKVLLLLLSPSLFAHYFSQDLCFFVFHGRLTEIVSTLYGSGTTRRTNNVVGILVRRRGQSFVSSR